VSTDQPPPACVGLVETRFRAGAPLLSVAPAHPLRAWTLPQATGKRDTDSRPSQTVLKRTGPSPKSASLRGLRRRPEGRRRDPVPGRAPASPGRGPVRAGAPSGVSPEMGGLPHGPRLVLLPRTAPPHRAVSVDPSFSGARDLIHPPLGG